MLRRPVCLSAFSLSVRNPGGVGVAEGAGIKSQSGLPKITTNSALPTTARLL